MVFDALGVGGTERVGASYAKLLVDAGHEVTVINLQPGNDEMLAQFPEACEYRTAQLGMAFQPDVFAVLLKRKWGKYVYPLAYVASRVLLECRKAVSRLFRRDSFDVAIAFSGHVQDLTYVGYNMVKSDRKLAWVHGSIADFLLYSYAFAFLYERIKNVCVLSMANQGKALEYFPRLRAAVSIHHLYNPIAQAPVLVDEAKRDVICKEYASPLVMVGRFDEDKDQETVIRALGVLKDVHHTTPHLVFVGDGPTRVGCEGLAQELGVAEQVHFAGTQTDVDTYYLACSFAVHSSPAEGLPTVLLEAMRDGAPVLATNSLPGVPEILGNSEYGLVCKVGDAQDMAEKMHAMLTDEEMRSGYRQKGTERVADFAPRAIQCRLEEILNGLTV